MFEVLQHDGLARIGRLRTAHGTITTPALLPVIDPRRISLPCNQMREFGGEALITNAYLLWRKFGSEAARLGVHGILGFEGPIMTDSGAYQLLRYGAVEIDPIEVVKYQESIGSDIATILDVPTGASATRESAENSVKATLRRAEEAQRFRSKENVLWCGPVQGGLFTDLVAKCAKAMGELDYDIHAVGSPVELLEDYRFSDVVRITMAAKLNLPIERPIHLFGVGHPMFFALGVAMGCDLFDSAAYALYARDGRYLTIGGTRKLSELGWFPCDCPVCVRNTPKDVLELPKNEQENFLIRHNLYVSFSEIRTIRQAIVEGTLFELLQQRCRAHPRLLDALREFYKYSSFIEQFDSVSKPSAFFYVGPEDKNRPEVLRHRSKLENYSPPAGKTLILYPAFGDEPKPITTAPNPHYVKVVPPFGPIPEELEEIYPLWQHEIPKEVDEGTLHATLDSVRKFLQKNGEKYVRAEVLADGKLGKLLGELCEEMMGKERVTVRVPDQTLL